MIIIYKKQTKKIEMISESKIKYDKNIFAEKKMDLTKKQLDEIYNAEKTFYKNSKLEIIPRIDKSEEKKKLKQELENADDILTIKEVINKLINL